MLHADHAAHLAQSAISAEILAARGYVSVTSLDDWRGLGMAPINKSFLHQGIAFPLFRSGRQPAYCWVLRPDRPRRIKGKTVKYEFPKGLSPIFDVLPRYREALGDPAIPLWITEGAKKADALASAYGDRIVPVNENGVYGFRGTNAHGGKTTIPDLDDVAWNGRQVVLAFDSDVARNGKVAGALKRLASLLIARGARQILMLLLPQVGDDKVGVDDFLARGHTVAELEAHLVPVEAGLAQVELGARVQLCEHPLTRRPLYLPAGYLVWSSQLAKRSRRGDPEIIYSGMLAVTAIGTDHQSGDEQLTVRWNGKTHHHGEMTAARALLATAKGVTETLAARGATIHPQNAGPVATYLAEFADANREALPANVTSAQLGIVGDGLLLPTGSVGLGRPIVYAGPTAIRVGDDPDAYGAALKAVLGWEGAWTALAVVGLSLASPLIARLRPRRNPAIYLAGDSGTGKTTIAQFATGVWGDPTAQPFLAEAHRTTAVGFRQTLAGLGGLPLFIDEAHTAGDPKRLEALVYEFANGQSYTKGTTTGHAAGGEALRGTLILAGEALPGFRHAGAQKRVLWVDCTAWPPLGTGTLGVPGGPERALGGQRAQLLEGAWEVGCGRFGAAYAAACWAQWPAVAAAAADLRDDVALRPLAAWREPLALAAVALDVAAQLLQVTLPPTGELLDRWVELLTTGQQTTDPATEAFDRLRTLLSQADEDASSYPGWQLLRYAREPVAWRLAAGGPWRVPTGSRAFEERLGRSAVQLHGRAWLRAGLITAQKGGTTSGTLKAPGGRSAAAIVVPSAVLGLADDDDEDGADLG